MSSTDNLTALVVEDDRDSRLIFDLLLKELKFTPQCVATGEEAIAMLEADYAPHLIVLDLHLPGISGLDVLEHIHTNNRKGPETKIIIVTADPALEIPHPVDRILYKPIFFTNIQSAIRQLWPPGWYDQLR